MRLTVYVWNFHEPLSEEISALKRIFEVVMTMRLDVKVLGRKVFLWIL